MKTIFDSCRCPKGWWWFARYSYLSFINLIFAWTALSGFRLIEALILAWVAYNLSELFHIHFFVPNFCLDRPFGFSIHREAHFCLGRPFGFSTYHAVLFFLDKVFLDYRSEERRVRWVRHRRLYLGLRSCRYGDRHNPHRYKTRAAKDLRLLRDNPMRRKMVCRQHSLTPQRQHIRTHLLHRNATAQQQWIRQGIRLRNLSRRHCSHLPRPSFRWLPLRQMGWRQPKQPAAAYHNERHKSYRRFCPHNRHWHNSANKHQHTNPLPQSSLRHSHRHLPSSRHDHYHRHQRKGNAAQNPHHKHHHTGREPPFTRKLLCTHRRRTPQPGPQTNNKITCWKLFIRRYCFFCYLCILHSSDAEMINIW